MGPVSDPILATVYSFLGRLSHTGHVGAFTQMHRERDAPPFLTPVAVFAFSLSLSPNNSDRVGTALGHRHPPEVAERPALAAAVAHSARPRPMATPISCFLCFPSDTNTKFTTAVYTSVSLIRHRLQACLAINEGELLR